MFKVLWLLKRKPGITFEQFRDHYENIHSVLAHRYLGHLMIGYTRNYNLVHTQGDAATPRGLQSSDVDCVAEWAMPNEEAFAEIRRLMADPVVGKIFRDDQAKFLDSAGSLLIRCDCRDTGTGDGAETLKLQAMMRA